MAQNKTYSDDHKEAYHMLICLIQVWEVTDKETDLMTPNSGKIEIAEVADVGISDSYKQLVNKATVKFPRGTVIRKTSETVDDVLEEAKTITATLDSRGILLTTRKNYSEVATVVDFAYGKRIRIYLGYTTDPEIASLPKFNATRGSIFTNKDLYDKYCAALPKAPAFDGYITRCSIDTPIELECEDLAHVLKQYNAPDIPQNKSYSLTVNDLLAEDGTYKMLKETGFKLFPQTKACNINIGPAPLNRDLTIADVLETWTKYHLYSYVHVDYGVTPPQPYIVVGRTYFTDADKDSLIKQREVQDQDRAAQTPEINFNYNVAENGLTLTESNKDFLCIQGQSMEKTGQMYHMTLRKNPEYHDGDTDKEKWQILNEVKLSKKAQRMGATVMSKGDNKVDLSRYTVIPYVSAKIGCTHDELLAELIKYYESYHMNGISGTLTLFGDLNLVSGIKVKLVDPYYPAKNGTYFVDEVNTKFGTGGFRQTIKLPYLIQSDSDESSE